MRKILFVALMATVLVGCLGTNRNLYDKATKQPWWQADTSTVTSNNPWLAFVKKPKSDEFSSWLCQRYVVVSPISSSSTAPILSEFPEPPKKTEDSSYLTVENF